MDGTSEEIVPPTGEEIIEVSSVMDGTDEEITSPVGLPESSRVNSGVNRREEEKLVSTDGEINEITSRGIV
jgi:hypothetical protein